MARVGRCSVVSIDTSTSACATSSPDGTKWQGAGPNGSPVKSSMGNVDSCASNACHQLHRRVPRGEASRREAMGRTAEVMAPSSFTRTDGGCPVAQVNDLSRSLTAFDPISTLVVVVEMSKASWLVSGVVPGIERQPLKKLESDATALLRLMSGGGTRRCVLAGRSVGSRWPMRPAATASGWRAGSLLAGSRRMSSIRQALRGNANATGEDGSSMRRC